MSDYCPTPDTTWCRFVHFLRREFYRISNVHPCIWMFLYLAVIPVFALIYWLMPVEYFRAPEGGGTGYGSFLYYSIVTISTLGYGDYTPAHSWAQIVTAIEVVTGLAIFGFFLNAVSSMKSDEATQAEVERQRKMRDDVENSKLQKSIPMVVRVLERFVADSRKALTAPYSRDSVHDAVHSASMASLALDGMQNHIDLSLWPKLMEDSFAFVASHQLFVAEAPVASIKATDQVPIPPAITDYLRSNSSLAEDIVKQLTAIIPVQ